MHYCSTNDSILEDLINEHRITLVSDKVRVIEKLSQRASLRQLWRFTGVVNYYRSFLAQCAKIITLLLLSHKNYKLTLHRDALMILKNLNNYCMIPNLLTYYRIQ